MSNLISFDFETHPVRVIDRDGEPWFVATDVCRALEIGHTPHAMSRLDEDEKATVVSNDSQPGRGPQSLGVVSESGLYSLILGSRKPAAKRFKKWVTAEVLPSIRKTGSYGAPGLSADEVAQIASSAAEAAVMRLVGSGAERARAEEYRLSRVVEDGIMVRELVLLLNLPASINRRSLSSSLTARLCTHFMRSGHQVHVRAGCRYFPRLASIQMAQNWRGDLIATAQRDRRQGLLRLVTRPSATADAAP